MKSLVVGLIVLYQRVVSPLKGGSCRFFPTCSEYALEAVEKYGVFVGARLFLLRILKCGPWNPGGYDPVP